jgi:putative ABC transport system permease protein
VAFTFALATAAAVVFGGVPALLSSRASGADALRAGVRATAARRQQRTRAALVISEVAIALTLLVTAALMIRSFARLQNVDPGFAPSGLLSLHVTLSRADYTAPPRMAGFFERALETLAALPGAEGAAAVEYLPFSGVDGSSGFYIEGRPAPARADEQQTHFRSASAEYFSLMRIPLAAGRAFTSADDENGVRVAIINEAMARRFWPAENPIGHRIALDLEAMRFFPDRPPVLDIAAGMREIVGIVRDVRHASLRSTADPEMYIPYLQRPVSAMTLLVRNDGDPSELAAAARQAIRTVDPNQPVAHIETVSNLVSASVAQPRANYLLLSAFAVVAVALAVIGVYGLLAFNVVQRTPELGIRLALGGSPADIRRLIVTQGARLVGAGIACGIPVALATASAARTLLFGVEPTDLVSFASSVVALSAAAMVACYLPARRATGVDPNTALRTE